MRSVSAKDLQIASGDPGSTNHATGCMVPDAYCADYAPTRDGTLLPTDSIDAVLGLSSSPLSSSADASTLVRDTVSFKSRDGTDGIMAGFRTPHHHPLGGQLLNCSHIYLC